MPITADAMAAAAQHIARLAASRGTSTATASARAHSAARHPVRLLAKPRSARPSAFAADEIGAAGDEEVNLKDVTRKPVSYTHLTLPTTPYV